MESQAEKILGKFMQLSPRTALRMRQEVVHENRKKWYVDFGQVVIISKTSPVFSMLTGSGETPQQAVWKAWTELLRLMGNTELVFLRYYCAPDEAIPGKGKKAWVRLNMENYEWIDVVPTDTELAWHQSTRDLMVSYKEMNKPYYH